jgi:hypothetical protein
VGFVGGGGAAGGWGGCVVGGGCLWGGLGWGGGPGHGSGVVWRSVLFRWHGGFTVSAGLWVSALFVLFLLWICLSFLLLLELDGIQDHMAFAGSFGHTAGRRLTCQEPVAQARLSCFGFGILGLLVSFAFYIVLPSGAGWEIDAF